MLHRTIYRVENNKKHPKLFKTLLQMLIIPDKAKSETILKLNKSVLKLLKLRKRMLLKQERTLPKKSINKLQ
jgi:hypothetical protein